MRTKFIFLLIFFTTAANAQSAEEQVKSSVEEWVKARLLLYPDTYTSVKFDEFEERTGFSDKAIEDRNAWLLMHHRELKLIARDSLSVELSEERNKELREMKDKAESHEEEMIGYKIHHTFMARDKAGNPLFYDGEFILDKKFVVQETVVRESEESTERTN